MTRRLPLRPGHPERVCWGCEKFCAANDMACGNGTDRAQHPIEIFGDDWLDVGLDAPFAAPAPGLPDGEETTFSPRPPTDAFNAR
jgi:hypothetical protein